MNRTQLILGLLTLIGTLLRFYQLHTDLWLDEVVSLTTYFRLSPLQTLFAYESPNQHLLYSLLASLSISAFGESAVTVRLPAALMGAASIPAIYFLARKTAPPPAALLSAALLALSYHHIWFSQSARGYSGMVLCTILGTAMLLTARKQGGRIWFAYAIVMALGIGFVQNTAFVLLGHALAVAIVDRRLPRLHLAATAGAIALALLLHAGILSKMVAFWLTEERTGWGSGITSFSGLAGLVARGLSAGFLLPGAILVLVVAALAWRRLWRTDRLIALLFVLPSILGIAAVLALQYGAYPRAFLHVLPFVLIAIAHLTHTASPLPRVLVPTVLLLTSALSLVFLYRYPKQDYTGALAAVRQRLQPGQRIAGAGMAGGVYRLYYAPEMPHIRTVAELKLLESESESVWVVYSFTRDMRLRYSELYDYLESNYATVGAHPGTLDDGTMYVVRRP